MARNKKPYQAKLVNGMYKVKKSKSFNKSTAELESLVKREIKEVNRRLKQLEKPIDLNRAVYNPKTKRYERPNQITFTTPKGKKRIKTSRLKNLKGLYVSKKLEDLGLTSKGRVKLRGNESRTELINLHANLSSFLKNKTSTKKGIKDVMSSTTESLGLNLDVEPEEAETLYNFFMDPDFKGVQEYIKGSDFMYILNDTVAKGSKDSNEFISIIRDYIKDEKINKFDNDLDMQNKLKRIYDKYLSVSL